MTDRRDFIDGKLDEIVSTKGAHRMKQPWEDEGQDGLNQAGFLIFHVVETPISGFLAALTGSGKAIGLVMLYMVFIGTFLHSYLYMIYKRYQRKRRWEERKP